MESVPHPARSATAGWLAPRVEVPSSVQALSLDVVLGILCAGSLAATVCGVTPPGAWWILLPMAAWVIYASDHLLDARRPAATSHSERHAYFVRHAARVAPWIFTAGVACGLIAVLGLEPPLWRRGLVLAAAAAIYLGLFHGARSGRGLKEPLGALLYTAGIWFVPLALSASAARAVLAVASLHGLAAWVNLVTFALFEEEADRRAGHPSVVRDLGRTWALRLLAALTVAGGLLAAGLLVWGPARLRAATSVLLLLALLPGVLWLLRRHVGAGGLYRWIGDGAFLLTALPWCLDHWRGAG